MTNEEKKLLLKSLCETAQYGVKGLALGKKTDTIKTICLSEYPFIVTNGGLTCHVGEQFKPYLRPMSSMTEEEDKDWQFYKCRVAESCDELLGERIEELHDWFNAHHFDFCGLIPMGLAIEAPEGMYDN